MWAKTLFPAVSCLVTLTAAQVGAAADSQQPTGAPDPATTTGAAATPMSPSSVTAQAPPAAPAPPAPKPSAILQQPGLLTLGWADWDLNGNQNKFRQWATPPSDGLFVEQLRYVPLSSAGNLGVFSLQDLGEPDYRDTASLSLFGGKTHFEALDTQSEFLEATPLVVPTSSRAVQDYYFQQVISNGFKLSTRYRSDQQDQYLEAGQDELHQRTRYNDLVARGRFAGGFLNLSYSNLYYWDRTGVLFNTQNQHWQAQYLRDINGSNSIEAKFSSHYITSQGAPDSYMQTMSLSDYITCSPSTKASIALAQSNISVPIVQDSYVKEQQSATFGLSHEWTPAWRGSFATQVRDVQRVNLTQTEVDDPKWETVEGRINGKFGDNWRLSVRASTVNLWGAPDMTVSDASLLWNSVQSGEARLQATCDSASGYLSYNVRKESNDAQGVTLTEDVWHLGGDVQATDKLDLTADWTNDHWGSTTQQTSFAVLVDTLGEYVTSSDTIDLGANWAMSPEWFLNANYSWFLTDNSNPLLLQDANTNGRYLTVELERRLRSGQSFSVTVSPWAYRDAVEDLMDYTSTYVMLSASTPF